MVPSLDAAKKVHGSPMVVVERHIPRKEAASGFTLLAVVKTDQEGSQGTMGGAT